MWSRVTLHHIGRSACHLSKEGIMFWCASKRQDQITHRDAAWKEHKYVEWWATCFGPLASIYMCIYRSAVSNDKYIQKDKVCLSWFQGSGDFWAQPAKIHTFATSTGFFQDLTGCKLVAIHLDRPISYISFQVSANFFFIVMTTGQELEHW
jgi:hypothetical protein